MEKILWAVDSLISKNGIIFGHGWIFHRQEKIRQLKLTIHHSDGQLEHIKTTFGEPREDVAVAFKESRTALFSGFFIFGASQNSNANLKNIHLTGTLSNNEKFDISLPETVLTNLDENLNTVANHELSFLKHSVNKITESFNLAKDMKFAEVRQKLKSYFSGDYTSLIFDAKKIGKAIRAKKRRILIIDHDFGGGANLYREKFVENEVEKGSTALIFTFNVQTLSYRLVVRSKKTNKRYKISGYQFIYDLAQSAKFHELIYNNAVGFPDPEDLAGLIVRIKKEFNLKLVTLIHDFFVVCPSPYLLDKDNKYCDIPDSAQCQSCITSNEIGFVKITRSQDIIKWRNSWSKVITVSDEVQVFSDNSLKLINKAFPAVNLKHAIVKPHKVQHIEKIVIDPTYKDTLKIGVVGTISYQKGANFIEELSNEIKRRNLEISIIVIGTIHTDCDSSIVKQTGQYQHNQLPNLIKETGVNIMLFPSIWAETFSYVVQELIEFGLPVACFNLGAPAERLSKYSKGLILNSYNPSLVFDELISFHKVVYNSEKNTICNK